MNTTFAPTWPAATTQPLADRRGLRSVVLAVMAFSLAIVQEINIGGTKVAVGGADLLFACGAAWLVFRFAASSLKLPLLSLCLLNFAAMAASTIYNHELSMRFLGLKGIVVWLAKTPFLWVHFFVLVNLFRERRDLLLFMRVCVVSAAAAAALGAYGSLAYQWYGTETAFADQYRAIGVRGDANAHAMALAVSFFLAFAYLQLCKKKKAWVYFALALLATGLFFTASRGGTLAFLGAAGLLWAMTSSWKAKLRGAACAGLLALVLLAAAGAGIGGSNPIVRRLTDASDIGANQTSDRVTLWKQAWEDFLDSPLLGRGRGNFGQVRPFWGLWHSQAHNVYLGLLAEVGLIGFLTWAALALYMFRELWRYRPLAGGDARLLAAAAAFLCAFAVIALHGLTSNVENDRSLWALFAIVEGFRTLYPAPSRDGLAGAALKNA